MNRFVSFLFNEWRKLNDNSQIPKPVYWLILYVIIIGTHLVFCPYEDAELYFWGEQSNLHISFHRYCWTNDGSIGQRSWPSLFRTFAHDDDVDNISVSNLLTVCSRLGRVALYVSVHFITFYSRTNVYDSMMTGPNGFPNYFKIYQIAAIIHYVYWYLRLWMTFTTGRFQFRAAIKFIWEEMARWCSAVPCGACPCKSLHFFLGNDVTKTPGRRAFILSWFCMGKYELQVYVVRPIYYVRDMLLLTSHSLHGSSNLNFTENFN